MRRSTLGSPGTQPVGAAASFSGVRTESAVRADGLRWHLFSLGVDTPGPAPAFVAHARPSTSSRRRTHRVLSQRAHNGRISEWRDVGHSHNSIHY